MDFTECKCRLLATIEMINKRHGKEITDMPYPGRVWEVLIRPALLSDTKHFIQREKASMLGMAFE